jgi:hypothetical protein
MIGNKNFAESMWDYSQKKYRAEKFTKGKIAVTDQKYFWKLRSVSA